MCLTISIDELLHIIGLACRQGNFSISSTNLGCISHEKYVHIGQYRFLLVKELNANSAGVVLIVVDKGVIVFPI